MMIPDSVRALLKTDTVAHVVTLARDGSPQVSIAWVGFERIGGVEPWDPR